MCQETNSSKVGFMLPFPYVFYLILLVNMVIIESQDKI